MSQKRLTIVIMGVVDHVHLIAQVVVLAHAKEDVKVPAIIHVVALAGIAAVEVGKT